MAEEDCDAEQKQDEEDVNLLANVLVCEGDCEVFILVSIYLGWNEKGRTDREHTNEEGTRDDAGDEFPTCRCAVHEGHKLSSVASLALPVIRAVLLSPLAPAVSSWSIDFCGYFLDFRVDKRVLVRQRNICGVAVVCLFWRTDLFLRDCTDV